MNSLLKTFTSALLLAVLQYREAESTAMCYTCASKGLQTQWQITGMQIPTAVDQSTFFSDICMTVVPAGQTPPAALVTPFVQGCTDFCFSMFITPVLLNGTNTVGDTQVVRGCHKDFTNFPMNVGTQITGLKSGEQYGLCEYGTITRYNNQTAAIDTPAGYQWCNVDIPSTGKTGDPTSSTPCNSVPGISYLKSPMQCNTGVKIPCYDCVEGSTVKPCNGASVKTVSTYCYKSDLWINGQHYITRSTSDINPLFPGATGIASATTQPQQFEGKCGYVNIAYPVQTRSGTVNMNGYDCYCNFQNYCNGAGQMAFSFVTVSLAILGSLFVKN